MIPPRGNSAKSGGALHAEDPARAALVLRRPARVLRAASPQGRLTEDLWRAVGELAWLVARDDAQRLLTRRVWLDPDLQNSQAPAGWIQAPDGCGGDPAAWDLSFHYREGQPRFGGQVKLRSQSAGSTRCAPESRKAVFLHSTRLNRAWPIWVPMASGEDCGLSIRTGGPVYAGFPPRRRHGTRRLMAPHNDSR